MIDRVPARAVHLLFQPLLLLQQPVQLLTLGCLHLAKHRIQLPVQFVQFRKRRLRGRPQRFISSEHRVLLHIPGANALAERDIPVIGDNDALKAFDEGTLAAPVSADDSHPLTGLNGKGNTI